MVSIIGGATIAIRDPPKKFSNFSMVFWAKMKKLVRLKILAASALHFGHKCDKIVDHLQPSKSAKLSPFVRHQWPTMDGYLFGKQPKQAIKKKRWESTISSFSKQVAIHCWPLMANKGGQFGHFWTAASGRRFCHICAQNNRHMQPKFGGGPSFSFLPKIPSFNNYNALCSTSI